MPSLAAPNPPQIEVTGAVGGSWCVYNHGSTLGEEGRGAGGLLRLAGAIRLADRSDKTRLKSLFFFLFVFYFWERLLRMLENQLGDFARRPPGVL